MDVYASLSFEAMRNTSPPSIGKRPLKSYICRPPEELYDLEADSEEVHNLGTLEYDSVLKQMWEAVEKWQTETKDLWLWKDGVSVQRFKEMDMRGMEVGFQIGLTLTLIIRDWGMSRRA
ncbi:hypothetical protein J3458_020318 [Metarhizium acridum]|uniref:uncharacterized protein n=1 Tax=Metarhizium acridum TaxID=92637 RepID=UPI001C6C50A5|nr:hypothetical protein J3458_020318 [Metarhizium acridum]